MQKYKKNEILLKPSLNGHIRQQQQQQKKFKTIPWTVIIFPNAFEVLVAQRTSKQTVSKLSKTFKPTFSPVGPNDSATF